MCRTLLQVQNMFDVVRSGSYEDVKLLLEKGADVYQKDNRGDTALILAARSGRLEIVLLLLDKGSDIHPC